LLKVLSFVIGVLVSSLLLKVLSVDISQFFIDLFNDALGSKFAISETLLKTIPLLICSIGVSTAFKMKLWNIGSEGQLYMGALASTIVALYFKTNSSILMITMMITASIVLGGIWSGIAGFLNIGLT